MEIYIHSSGRAYRQTTLRSIPYWRLEDTCLVIQNKECRDYKKYEDFCNVVTLPRNIKTLSPTRQWILENAKSRYIIIMDDDLKFFQRVMVGSRKGYLNSINDRQMDSMLGLLNTWLITEQCIHCGISAREGNNRVLETVVSNARMMRVLAYDRIKVLEANARFDRLPTKQDFDMTLQLLRKGYSNKVSYYYAHNQYGSQDKGGCSVYRTDKMMYDSSVKLAKLHPGLVKVVTKKSKVAWKGKERIDVRISWKKAYEESKS